VTKLGHEMSTTHGDDKGVGAGVAVQGVGQDSSMNEHDSSNPYANTAIAYEDQDVVDNQGRLRRLFSFVQLLAFALTFMSSWEVIAM
jgi:choline transport protein